MQLVTMRVGVQLTLVEVIVLSLIILILIGLFLPWAGNTRRDSARVRCMNNLKQLALSLHSYADRETPSDFLPGHAHAALLRTSVELDRRIVALPGMRQLYLHRSASRMGFRGECQHRANMPVPIAVSVLAE